MTTYIHTYLPTPTTGSGETTVRDFGLHNKHILVKENADENANKFPTSYVNPAGSLSIETAYAKRRDEKTEEDVSILYVEDPKNSSRLRKIHLPRGKGTSILSIYRQLCLPGDFGFSIVRRSRVLRSSGEVMQQRVLDPADRQTVEQLGLKNEEVLVIV